MITVNIEYQPIRFLKFTRFLKGHFPQHFSELTAKQLIAVACLVKGSISEINFLQAMTGFKKGILKKLDEYQRFKLIELFTVFNDRKPFSSFILTEFKQNGTKFIAPKPKLKGLTFGRFIFADTYFSDYQTNSNPADLIRFVASLYLPQNSVFNENLIDENAETLKNTPIVTLEAIAINYHLIREWLAEVYPLVFIKEQEDFDSSNDPLAKGDERSGGGKPKPANNGWIKILESIVGDDIIHEDDYANKPVHNIFRFMTKKIKENMKRKK